MHPFVRRVPPSSLIRIRIAESRMTLLRISVTRSDEPRFHRASLLPLPHRPNDREWKGGMNGMRSWIYITELCNRILCVRLVGRRLIVSRERKNDDCDKWSAFIMQQSTITTGIMRIDR